MQIDSGAHRADGTRRRGLALVILAVVAVVAAAITVAIARAGNDPPPIPKNAIRVDVSPHPVSRRIAPGYVGLSIEYPSSIGYSGRNPNRPNLVYVKLVRGLNPGHSPIIRFGGDTADWTWWPTPGVRKPRGIRYTLTRRWLNVTRATARALNARLILGINFEADSRRIAGTEARVLLAGIGRRYVAGLELGNEPEVYGTLPWYTTPGGVPVPGRPASYGFASFLPDYANVVSALPRHIALVGPASGAGPWLTGLGRYLKANRRVRIATFHRYPLHRCFTPRGSPAYPTIANLLSPLASSGPAVSLRAGAGVAHAHGVPLRSDELNSVSCGGAHGVSDTFASALWILDTLFNMARAGVDGVNIHTFRTGTYAPFSFSFSRGRWSAQVKPMYYGMLLFGRGAPPGSRLLHTRFSGPRAVRIWSTRGPDGRIRATLINASRRHAVTLAVRLPAGGHNAILQRLRAPRVGAKRGVTIAGQSYGSHTLTGALTGSAHSVSLVATHGRFVIRLPAASAALVTVS
ncbi:MAG: glycosyl hydrolase family 79 C-terminal domain-containing protein [Actinomycetota bacterium]|nr:glycosyl hydrolase family 79 C-terminal domain-containing protein [Actinomycetota bacterium]